MLGGYPKYLNIRFECQPRYHSWYLVDIILGDIRTDVQLVGYHLCDILSLDIHEFILDVKILIFKSNNIFNLGLGYQFIN
jgi:hypothetical protein